MFQYNISAEKMAEHLLEVAQFADEIKINPDELASSLFCMKVIYGDIESGYVDYLNGSLIVPMKYMGCETLERFVTTYLIFKLYYRDADKDANTTEYDPQTANEFIAAILMPKKEFTRLYDVLTVEELAKVFGVTQTLVRFRANRLKLLKS